MVDHTIGVKWQSEKVSQISASEIGILTSFVCRIWTWSILSEIDQNAMLRSKVKEIRFLKVSNFILKLRQ